MLAIGLGHATIDAGHRVCYTTAADLVARYHKAAIAGRWANTMRFFAAPQRLIIDPLGYLPLTGEAASTLFQIVNRRYTAGASIVLATNRGISQWGQIFDDPVAAGMLDRLMHRSIDGDSYRMRTHRNHTHNLRKAITVSDKPARTEPDPKWETPVSIPGELRRAPTRPRSRLASDTPSIEAVRAFTKQPRPGHPLSRKDP